MWQADGHLTMNADSSSAMNRRRFLSLSALGSATGLAGAHAATAADASKAPQFRYCLNMSTIMGNDLKADEEVEIAGKAGYDAIEPWMRRLNAFTSGGGSLKDLRKRIQDHGLTVESAIGFAKWIVNNPEERAKGMEEAKRDMDMLAQIGAVRMAAPPAGVPRGETVEPAAVAERYRALLELGDQMGITPQIEMWGGNATIGKVSTAIWIALEADHPKACFLGDVYHTYKGGCGFEGFKLLSAQSMQVFHFNDYPSDPPRETINDSHRVYPGDGIAPITQLLHDFVHVGARPVLSLELFNREYWKKPAAETAATGLQKMKTCVSKAFA